jgi:hypothetical protein|tara:strand:+ start:157 stop:756 length:600 start_codon:yes stop_codon:yes gene_type:complete
MPHQINHPFPSETQQNGGGAAVAGQVADVASGLIDTSDPLAKNSIGKSAGKKSLELAAMGAAFGPWGALGGAVVGGVVGTVEGSKAKEEALKGVEINKGITASAEVDKNKYEMEQYDYSKINPDGTMATKYGVVKKLGAITGTVANNMSVAQYNSAIKMSGIAMKLADKDYDKDGVVEDSTKEYLDSRSNAIKENKKNN